MASKKNAETDVNVAQLFSDISKHFRNGKFKQGQLVCNKILKAYPNDVDAIQCKVACLIQQSHFQEAHDVINSAKKKELVSMPFEKAYCLYRMNNLQDARALLKGIESPEMKEKELLAQVEYRLESYSTCLDLYKDLVKNSADDYGDEREANMAAVIAAAKMWKNETVSKPHIRLDTYELTYNYGCLLLAQGELIKAEQVLKNALEMCQQFLAAEDDISEEEMEEELGVIRAQLGYIQQLQGKSKEALVVYNAVMKNKPTDTSLAAVVSNNIISIHKEHDLFDSKKRVKSLNVDGLHNKMTAVQLRAVEMNKCLVYLYTNQMDKCRKSMELLKTRFLDPAVTDKVALLEAAIFLKDKNSDNAFDHLQGIISSGMKSNDILLTLAQLHLTKGKIEEALKVLKDVDDIKYSPALLSLCVGLFNTLGKKDMAIKYLDDAIAFGKQNPSVVSKKNLVTFMRESSNLKLSSGKVESAISTLEDLRREQPDDIGTLAKIVAAYSNIDLKKAQQYSVDLPDLDFGDQEVDLNMLEMTDQIGSFRFSKKTVNKTIEDTKKEEVSIKRKKRKRKPGKLPKNYNPDVDPDPERWLPRWERSTFKHKKAKKGNVGKGTQGAVANDQPASPKPSPKPDASAASPKPGGSSATNSPSVVPPRQQKPSAKSKSKKKKGKGW